MKFDTQRMKRLVSQHWSQATDLADAIVGSTNLSFREAHRVVGALVARSIASGTPPEAVTLADLKDAADGVLKERVDFSRLNLSDALDPQKGLERRQVTGGPAPNLVRLDVEAAQLQLVADTIAHEEAEGTLKSASRALRDQTQGLLSGLGNGKTNLAD